MVEATDQRGRWTRGRSVSQTSRVTFGRGARPAVSGTSRTTPGSSGACGSSAPRRRGLAWKRSPSISIGVAQESAGSFASSSGSFGIGVKGPARSSFVSAYVTTAGAVSAFSARQTAASVSSPSGSACAARKARTARRVLPP